LAPGGAQRAQKPYPVSKDMALAGMKESIMGRAICEWLDWPRPRSA